MFTRATANNKTGKANNNSLFNKSETATPFIQAKLAIGKPNDKYEVEADSVAEKVVSKTQNSSSLTGATPFFPPSAPNSIQKASEKNETIQEKPIAESITPSVQLAPMEEETIQEKCDSCESEQENVQRMPFEEIQSKEEEDFQKKEDEESVQMEAEEEAVQAKSEEEDVQMEAKEEEVQTKLSAPALQKSNIGTKLKSSRGSGSMMPKTLLAQMQQGFGADFSQVKIHTGPQAVAMSKDLGAKAFTNKNHVYFNQGKFDPGSRDGQLLLAHELTHTIQQGAVNPLTSETATEPSTSEVTTLSNIASETTATTIQQPTDNSITSEASEVVITTENSSETTTEETPELEVIPRSPEEDPNFISVENSVEYTADQQGEHEAADIAVGSAQSAAAIPSNEQMGTAQANQVEQMDAQEPGEFDAVAFKAKLMKRIEEMELPADEEAADKFDKNNNIQEISNAASNDATQEQQAIAGPIAVATEAPPNVEAVPQREVSILPNAPVGHRPASVSAQNAMPNARPESHVSQPLQENMSEVDQQMAENEVTDEQLANSNEPAFTSALGSRDEARSNTESAPDAFRQTESQSLTASQQQAENSGATGISEMHQNRDVLLNDVVGQQSETGTQNTSERERISNEIDSIYESTKIDVETLLDDLDIQVAEKFDTAATNSKQDFEDYVDLKMSLYKAERYSGIGGAFTWVGDVFTGLPDEVNEFFVQGRKLYINIMDVALTDISNYIALKLNEAKNRIETGKQEVTDYVDALPENLQSIGKEAAEEIQDKFDELTDSVNSKQDELIDSLAQQYNDSLTEIDERIDEMKAANRGLIDMAMDAINGVIETISKLKQLITDLLAEIQSVLSIIMADPIGFVSNLFDGIKQGFDNFVTNIETHLLSGFVQWLTGSLGPMGITIPENLFSLKGIFSLVMQVLGLSWDYMREKAVKLLGEPVVQAMEFGLEMFQIIRTQGVAGIWEYLKEQFNDLKETIIDSIKEMLITQVIEAGIKWLLSLLIPGAGFIKAIMAIKDFIVFFVESALMLIPALIEAIRAMAAGSVSLVATAIERGLALLVPLVIKLFAKIIGLGGLVGKVQKIIKKVRKRIDRAINKLIIKAKKASRKLLQKLGIGKGEKSEGEETDERTAEEKQEDVKSAVQEGNELLDKADATPEDVNQQLPGIKTKYSLEKIELLQDATTGKYYIRVKINPEGETEKESLGQEVILNFINKKLLKSNNTEISKYGNDHKSEIEGAGYKFLVQNDKYYIRRKSASDSAQVHIDKEGKLKLGPKSGSSEPEHDNYIPTNKKIEEVENGYVVTYATKTDEGNEGPEFKINISYDKALSSNEDITETRVVEGSSLKLKNAGGARGKTDSAHQGFHNAHLIADRFGGSGKNKDQNIYPSSPDYNTSKMKKKEDDIAKNLQDKTENNQSNFELEITSKIKGEKADSSSLKAAINEEAKKDNTIQVQEINDQMSNDLIALVRKDIKGIPGKFMSVNYKLNNTTAGDLKSDSGYDSLVEKLIKKKT
ncbi:eCIS core domain-containing protein [Ulvibacter antarcticus]|uniref:DNA/RNA non-specific endonuclease n=1 Tax=Ulvibacter antarcticus TaxID=442714 RepID=A0A3L9YDY0_9FLAO|nr:DUF4157 domain-containing protein [Ulvibacter antarcticus]RMA58861.1 DNA/RNA non-specific endonuclease [Ulvibacter antarcticus]